MRLLVIFCSEHAIKITQSTQARLLLNLLGTFISIYYGLTAQRSCHLLILSYRGAKQQLTVVLDIVRCFFSWWDDGVGRSRQKRKADCTLGAHEAFFQEFLCQRFLPFLLSVLCAVSYLAICCSVDPNSIK